MDWKKVLYFVVLLNVFGQCRAYFETCDQSVSLNAGETKSILSPGLESGYAYPPDTSCRYTIVAPVDYQVRASCYMNMPGPTSTCSNQRFYFAIDGRKDLSTSYYYCGEQTIALTSQGNQMVLAYISSSYSGYFNCTVSTVCDCGWSVTSRIVGGSQAGVNEFPPMTALSSMTNAKIYCGATLVSSRFVLTAAHCLRVTPINNTAIVVGEHNTKTGTDTSYTAVYRVLQFIEHPSYSTLTNLNDIGLVKSDSTILYSRAVAPVCLPFFYTSSDFSGQTVTATGWGSTEFGGPSSDILLKVNLNVLSNANAQCRAAYPNIASTQMCSYTAQKDTCQYDSGGPLFFRGPTDPRLFLVGLVSLGDGCGGTNPALNSRITSFLGWIEQVIGPGLCRRVLQ